MEDLQALVILRSLANGVDPESGPFLESRGEPDVCPKAFAFP